MIIRKLKESDIPQAKALWQHAFGDSDEYIDFYFKNRFCISDSLGAFDNGKLVSDITMQQKNLHIRGETQKIAFIAGTATYEDYRNRGICRDIFIKEYEILRNEGYAFCMLYPFKHSFYRKLGFESISEMYFYEARSFNKQNSHETDSLKMYNMYCDFMKDFDCNYIKSYDEFKIKLWELFNDGGKAVITEESYALYYEKEKEIEIIENTAKNERQINCLLQVLPKNDKKIIFSSPYSFDGFGNKKLCEHTMARIINIKKAFESVVIPKCDFVIAVCDELCSWNNGNWHIISDGKSVLIKNTQKKPDFTYDIKLTAKMLFGFKNVKNEILRKQKSVFFDTY